MCNGLQSLVTSLLPFSLLFFFPSLGHITRLDTSSLSRQLERPCFRRFLLLEFSL